MSETYNHLVPSINGSLHKQGLYPLSIKQRSEIDVQCKQRQSSEPKHRTGES
jgi:hypothetical protein